ncbi:SRPBCC domain-containing protein [Mammaliicoccus stepanovicii]|uniref:Activator of Hsp90 ATPase homolog 1-like protein n=1 Tax=Mammaliicoccus stepanovicii TaxID=643214 RepID=A0A239ZVI4_9STAP|nr:SRPBCC domain-containing protein [Mammaliicoccus stepanovicii]PNZ77440.1 hypothetical protein CD111_04535 [Mammaliicoccus stepanovicii]GGI39023.1 hypothetical protein GCM10010896_01310 [Mammaliicoccus stepanovicii]SNV74880.1 Activator of Hsp90 ATPase homolog 1-like protein [Mammaliicoccus stepanovicii]
MKIETKMKINAHVHDIYQSFLDSEKMAGFWFSSFTNSFEEGNTVTLNYKEYNAKVEIKIVELIEDKLIKFEWGNNEVEIHFITEGDITIVKTIEQEFDPNDVETMLNQKEGWVYMLSCLKAYIEYNDTIRGALL